QQFERLARLPVRGEVARKGKARSPFLSICRDQPAAEGRKPSDVVHLTVRLLEAREREVRALGRCCDESFPGRHRRVNVSLRQLDVAEIQIRRSVFRVEIDRRLKSLGGLAVLTVFHCLEPELVFWNSKDLLVS